MEMHVRWRDHEVGLLGFLRQMLASEAFVDVTLCCQNRRLNAHRILLSASSPYLQELLLAHPANDHTTIILDDIEYDDMRSLLDFIYTGGVTVPEERLESFLKAAETLSITVLRDTGLHTKHHQLQQHHPPVQSLPPHQLRQHHNPHQQHLQPPHGQHHQAGRAAPQRLHHPARILTPCPWASPRPPPRRPLPQAPTYQEAKIPNPLSPQVTELFRKEEPLTASPPVIKVEPLGEGATPRNGKTKLCALKERRLQEFYREQMMMTPDDLSLRSEPVLKQEAPSPLQELKSLTGLLEEKSASDRNNNEGKPMATINSCQECGVPPFPTADDLLAHASAAHNPQQQPSPQQPQHHQQTNGQSQPQQGPFACSLCPKQFAHRGHWTAHQKLHAEAKPEHACTHCGKTFVTRASLKVHTRTHTGEKPFQCTECGKQFSQLRNYKYHRSVHEGTREFAATCPECGKYFNDRGYLSSHMKIHRNRKEYGCEYCGKSFNQRVAYNMHVRIHTGEKPHGCQHCGKRFSRKMLLKQHLRIHTGEKPFSCVVCHKAFADRSNMTLHMRLHSGVKPYTCTVCSKSFTKKHHLKTHMNYHTGLKPYSCEKCGLKFSQSSNMRTHFKKCTSTSPTQQPATAGPQSTATPPIMNNSDESSSCSTPYRENSN